MSFTVNITNTRQFNIDLTQRQGPSGPAGESGYPTEVLSGETFTVPARRQFLYSVEPTIQAGGQILLGEDSQAIQVRTDFSDFLLGGTGASVSWNPTTKQWTVSSTGGVSDGNKGDIVVSDSGATWTVKETTPLITSDTAPPNPQKGWRWLDTTDGTEYTWIVTNGQGQWVELGVTVGGFSADTWVELLADYGITQAAVWDLDNLATLWQNTAGTTPVTAYGDPVGKVDDISGFGNHFTASSDANRPTYARRPKDGRRNLLERTEAFENAYWTKSSATISVNADAPPGLIDSRKLIPTGAFGGSFARAITWVVGEIYYVSCYAKAAEFNTLQFRPSNDSGFFITFNLTTGTVQSIQSQRWSNATIQSLGNGWYRLSAQYVPQVTDVNMRFLCPTAASGSSGVLITGTQIERQQFASDYQRVVTAFDVTEPGKPSYNCLVFDGTNDCLRTTSTVNFGSDEVTAILGVRKLSDAAQGTILELGASVDANNGSWQLTAPNGASTSYAFRSRGISTVTAETTAFKQPDLSVLTGRSSIAKDSLSLRRNGRTVASTTGDQGVGYFNTATLFMGARNDASARFSGEIYSGFVANKQLDNEACRGIEAWLGAKCGVVTPELEQVRFSDAMYSWWSGPLAVTTPIDTYIGITNDAGHAIVRGVQTGVAKLLATLPKDDHIAPALFHHPGKMPIALWHNRAASKLYWQRGTVEGDFTSLGVTNEKDTPGLLDYDYQRVFYIESTDEIYVFGRMGNDRWVFFKSTDDGVTFEDAVTFFDTGLGDTALVYISFSEPIGDIVRCALYTHPSSVPDIQSVYYCEVNFATGAITRANGTAIGNLSSDLPLTFSTLEKIYDADDVASVDRVRMFEVSSHSEKQVTICTWDSTAPINERYYGYLHWNGTAWVYKSLATAGVPFGYNPIVGYQGGVTIPFDSSGHEFVLSREDWGTWLIERLTSSDAGDTFTTEIIAASDRTKLVRPIALRGDYDLMIVDAPFYGSNLWEWTSDVVLLKSKPTVYFPVIPTTNDSVEFYGRQWVYNNRGWKRQVALPRGVASHTHGNISNAGAIGTTADLPISTTASGVINTRTVADFRALLGLATTDSPTFAGLTVGTSGAGAVSSYSQPFFGRLSFAVTPNNNISEIKFASAGATGGTGRTYFVIGSSSGSSDTGDNLLFGVSNGRAFLANAVNYIVPGVLHLGGQGWGADGVVTIEGSIGGNTGVTVVRGRIEQRNGTNGQISRIYNTFTSSTNLRALQIDCTDANNIRIGSLVGSLGGTALGLQFGTTNAAGAWTRSFEVDQFGNVRITAGASVLVMYSGLQTVYNADQWIRFSGRSSFDAPALDRFRFLNSAGTDAPIIQLGGVSSSFPAFKRNGTTVEFRLADDSAFAPLSCSNITTSGTIRQATEPTSTPTGTTQTITLANGNHQTLDLGSASGAVTVTLTVPASSSAGSIIVQQGATVRDITWTVSSGTMLWVGGEPDWAADAIGSSRTVGWRWNGSSMRFFPTEAVV